jgi:hypothetical protein
MPYTRPAYDAADADFSASLVYTLPDWDDVDASFVDEDPEAIIRAPSVLGDVEVLVDVSVAAYVSVGSVLGDPAILGDSTYNHVYVAAASPLGEIAILGAYYYGFISVASPLGDPAVLGALPTDAIVDGGSPLGTPRVLGNVYVSASISAESMLGAPACLVLSDIGDTLQGLSPQFYAADITTPSGVTRLRISSWTASLEVDKASYIGFVTPGVTPEILEVLDEMTSFTVVRYAALADGYVVESLVAAAVQSLSVQTDEGPTNTTAAVAGYTSETAYPTNNDPLDAWDRTLTGVRSVSVFASGLRVRAAIDWMLVPGQRAFYSDGGEIIASRITYNANAADSYMDVTEVISG